MVVMERPLPLVDETRQAFDAVAATYDRSNAENPILSVMRAQVVAAIVAHVPKNGLILDLGCGPGADEEALARAGYSVTAIDSSAEMIEQTRQRARHTGLEARIDAYRLGIHELDQLPTERYDLACSNFGPLNCVPSLHAAAHLIRARLRPRGMLVASVIGRICPWELALYLSRGDRSRARIRYARQFVAVPLAGGSVWTRYYTPREFERAFSAAGFRRLTLHALGLFVPPPYMESFARRHHRLVAWLQRCDRWLGGWPGFRSMGDHFLIVMRKE